MIERQIQIEQVTCNFSNMDRMMKFANEHFDVVKFSSSHVEQNKASGHVMEKCGLHFAKYGQFQKLDGSNKMRSMEYEGEIKNF